MGRIKSLAVKRTARNFLDEHSSLFSENFEKNKEVIRKIVRADKSVQNKLAGHITKLKKKSHAKL